MRVSSPPRLIVVASRWPAVVVLSSLATGRVLLCLTTLVAVRLPDGRTVLGGKGADAGTDPVHPLRQVGPASRHRGDDLLAPGGRVDTAAGRGGGSDGAERQRRDPR